ncbi:TPR domain-containing protein [Colletotrichum tofieldiae]|nr:TPR domain-containing protein [Colletotrichum tofieldiae]
MTQNITKECSQDLRDDYIEYFFGLVKNRIRKRSQEDEDLIQGDFKSYLQMQIRVVGEDKKIARGHFRKAQIAVDEL